MLTHPDLQDYFGLTNGHQLQTVMFLQLVPGGHLVLFITRTERWFFLPPFPAPALFIAIVLTQILAVLMCGFGLLVPPIPWTLIGWVWAYNIAWMFVLGGVRLITERFAAYRTARHSRSVDMVNQSLRLHAAAQWRSRMDYREKFVVEPGAKVRLSKIDASYTGKHETHEAAQSEIQKHIERLDKLQYCFTRTENNLYSSCYRLSMPPAKMASFGTYSAA